MKIGYMRVSTAKQKPDRQIDGLTSLCDELHIEKRSAVSRKRPVFEHVLEKLVAGDTLVVWDLDRAFRSTVEAITHAEQLRKRGVAFQVVNLGADTNTADGMLIYTVIAALAQHERSRLSERTKQGIEAARRRGIKLGPKPKLTTSQICDAREQIAAKQATFSQLAELYGVHATTIMRSIKRTNMVESE